MHHNFVLLLILQRGLTALHLSASRGHLDALKALVKEFKLDPNAVDKVSLLQMM